MALDGSFVFYSPPRSNSKTREAGASSTVTIKRPVLPLPGHHAQHRPVGDDVMGRDVVVGCLAARGRQGSTEE
jgi:hypothetical protein